MRMLKQQDMRLAKLIREAVALSLVVLLDRLSVRFNVIHKPEELRGNLKLGIGEC